MRLPISAHEARPWRIHEIAPDFVVEDVWALPVEGGAGDFPKLVEVLMSLDLAGVPSALTRLLFDIRLRMGGLFGWDDVAAPLPIPGNAETTLRSRVPADLRSTITKRPTTMGALEKLGVHFAPLYFANNEFAAETSNRTVHGVIHLAWVEQGNGRYQGQMAIYVKPRGWLGHGYMELIKPFRYLVVYPALLRHLERAWSLNQA
jgi:hypothetical protein